ncbi:hypothetical protein [Risungbinella massiliensis]|uniref:hypothetical protein n=1 Tax=Risungbinella massiliensis TaxID=1329796 RepID=UPI0005CC05C1|nr:hypothetical protein [Risungbinella massiliensis]
MAKLSAALLAGKQHREIVELVLDGETFEVEIRPLTHIEKAEIQALESSSIKVNTKNIGTSGKMSSQALEMNTGEVLKDQARALLRTVALGTIDEEWTEENIDQLWRSEWIQQVGNRISAISGIERADLDSFRQE